MHKISNITLLVVAKVSSSQVGYELLFVGKLETVLLTESLIFNNKEM